MFVLNDHALGDENGVGVEQHKDKRDDGKVGHRDLHLITPDKGL